MESLLCRSLALTAHSRAIGPRWAYPDFAPMPFLTAQWLRHTDDSPCKRCQASQIRRGLWAQAPSLCGTPGWRSRSLVASPHPHQPAYVPSPVGKAWARRNLSGQRGIKPTAHASWSWRLPNLHELITANVAKLLTDSRRPSYLYLRIFG